MASKIFGSINVGSLYSEEGITFYLVHSCDEWVIGDLESAKKFLGDLTEAIKYYEETLLPPTTQLT